MEPTTTILIGAPLSGEEARFLTTLHADLSSSNALILANFYIGERQLDFVVVTPSYATILELKNIHRPIFGHMNGTWSVLNAAGKRVPYAGGNPWHQALQQKYALSDEMKLFQAKARSVPSASKGRFFSDFDCCVCVYPAIHSKSEVIPGDHRVRVLSYPDAVRLLRSEAKCSSWSQQDWRRFAEEHLRLSVASLEEATDPKVRAATERLNAYRSRFREIVAHRLPPLLLGNDEAYGQVLVETLTQPQNFSLVGPTGSTKTFHLHHAALAILNAGTEVPFVVEAKRYKGGDFWTFLRAATAPLYRGDPGELLEAARLSGQHPALLVDALNETDTKHVPLLMAGAQAFAVQYGARVLLTSQVDLVLPGDLAATTIRLGPPGREQKRAIYAYHAGLEPTYALDAFCSGFTNAYDLTVAGCAHNSASGAATRVEVYDRYVRRVLPEHTAVATALLRFVAGQMAATFSLAWPRDVFERQAEVFLSSHKAPLGILDQLRTCRLLTVTDDYISFEHELLYDYFRAEDLRRRVTDDTLAADLAMPRNCDLLEFVLPRLTRTVLDSVLPTVHDAELLARVLRGDYGSTAADALRASCLVLLEAALQDLPSVGLEVNTYEDESGRHLAGVAAVGSRSWTKYEGLLCYAITANLHDPALRRATLELVDLTEWTLRKAAQELAATHNLRPTLVWAEVVRNYGGVGHFSTLQLPCVEMLWCIRQGLVEPAFRGAAPPLPIAAELLERTRRTPSSDFALLTLLARGHEIRNADDVELGLALVQQAWASGIYILRLEALQCLETLRKPIDRHCPQKLPEIRTMLEGYQTANVFLSTVLIDALTAFDALPEPVSYGDALAEMTALVSAAPVDEQQEEAARSIGTSVAELRAKRAYGCLGRIFEDVFQGVYWNAYSALSTDARIAILCLAATAPENGFHTDWILEELLSCADDRALPVYRRHAARIDPSATCTQEAVAVFAAAIEGCARWSDSPPLQEMGHSPQEEAWRTVAELLFWEHSKARHYDQARVDGLWASLSGPLALPAADVFYQLHRARMSRSDRAKHVDFIRARPEGMRSILRQSIASRDRLPSLFRWGGTTDPDIVPFLVRTLGAIGDLDDITALLGIVDEVTIGQAAVAAIEAIQKRVAYR